MQDSESAANSNNKNKNGEPRTAIPNIQKKSSLRNGQNQNEPKTASASKAKSSLAILL